MGSATLREAARGWPVCAAIAATFALLPAAASGETRTYVSTTPLFPSQNAGIFGPANQFPSSIVVSDAPGAVTEATLQVIGLDSGNADDLDMAIRGPNGQTVMLMSDACGGILPDRNWTFDDDAPIYLPDNGSCGGGNLQVASLLPSNYGSESDDLSPDGGPPPPYLNAFSFFDDAPANGSWDLFMRDDTDGILGFSVDGWVLTLEVDPPTPAPTPASPATPSGKKKKCKKKSKKPSASAKKCKKPRKK